MEDQLMALKALDVPAAMLNATSTKEEVKSIQNVSNFYKFKNGINLVAV
jgi:superfamily II DNA helicase RecQ